jgi:hypothetical protein
MSIFKIEIKPGTPATYDPNTITVYVNDSVFWFNSDTKNAHWPAPSASNPKGFMQYQVPPDTSSSQVSFAAPQTIPYICVNHSGESGTIIVKSAKKKGAFGPKTKKGAFGPKTKKGAFAGGTTKGTFGKTTR